MRLTVMVCALLFVACAAPASEVDTAPPAPVFDPVGVYDFSAVSEGQTVNGTITIRRDDQGVLDVLIATPVTGTMRATSVTLEGRSMEVRTAVGGEGVLMLLDFTDDRVSGGWQLTTGVSGAITGRRRNGSA